VGSPSAPRPMRADARRNYERIVAVAREAFAEHGPEAPLDDIARRACVGPGTLYRHFPCREDLIEAVYRADIEQLSRRAHELLETHSPEDALAAWLHEQIDFVLRKRGLATTLKAAMGQNSETFQLCKTMINDAAAALLVPAQAAGTVRADVEPLDVLRLGHAIGVAAETTPESAKRLLNVVLEGLRPHQA
jgi:AcrR family transcriptional regulator